MRLFLSFFFIIIAFVQLNAQVYYTRTGHVHVRSQNNIKNIEADNYQTISTIDLNTSDVRFEGLLKSFEFKLGALDRVFNSDRINVNQYPKFRFEGNIIGLKNLDLSRVAEYKVLVKGTLYLWDEKRITSADGIIESDGNGGFTASSMFVMRIEEKSMVKLNQIIDQKLPDIVNVSTDSFGVDRDIQIDLTAKYTLRNW